MTQSTIAIEIDGQCVKVGSCGFLIRYLAEQELRRLRRAIFEETVKAVGQLDKGIAETVLLSAYRDFSNTCIFMQDELNAWLSSPSGLRWQFGQWLKAGDNSITEGQVNGHYAKIKKAQLDEIDAFQSDCLNPNWREELKRERIRRRDLDRLEMKANGMPMVDIERVLQLRYDDSNGAPQKTDKQPEKQAV